MRSISLRRFKVLRWAKSLMKIQVLLAGSTALSAAASAQELNFQEPQDVAGNRPQPSYDAQGVRVSGDIFAYPEFGVVTEYQSNVYSRASNGVGDVSFTALPALMIQQNRPDARFRISGDARIRRYATYTSENDVQYSGLASFNLDRAAGLGVSGEVGYNRFTAQRGTVLNSFQTGKPLQARDLTGRLKVSKEFNRLRVTVDGSYRRTRYDDLDLGNGGRIDQSFRDQRRFDGEVEVRYNVSPRFGLAATGGLTDDNFTDPNPLTNRDATGKRALAGVRYELTRLIEISFDAGYRSYSFSNKLYPDSKGLALHGRVRWYPDELVSVRADLRQENQTSNFGNVSTVVVTRLDVATDYEFRRNVVFTLRASGANERYENVRQTAFSYYGSGSVTWKANRWLNVTGSLGYEGRDHGSTVAPTYNNFRAMLGVKLVR